MQFLLRVFLCTVTLGSCLTLLSCKATDDLPRSLMPGQAVPPFTLQALDNSQISLSSFRGKLIVLNVWATWCAPCRRELPSLERLRNKLDYRSFVVVALSIDQDDHVVREYLLDKKINLMSYLDRDGQTAMTLLGVKAIPETLIISSQGTLLARISGERKWDEQKILDAIQKAHRGDSNNLSSAI